MATSGMDKRRDYYQLLELESRPNTPVSAQELKAAYRRALLRHHPDKSDRRGNTDKTITVDDVALAYKTLSEPKLKAEYDLWLLNAGASKDGSDPDRKSLHTGLETVDLDDLDFDADNSVWSRSCRCGDEHGFIVSETDLEQNVEDGEVFVGCKGCSLWLRVLFGVE